MQKTPKELIERFYENERNFIVNEAIEILATTTDDSLKLRALELLEKLDDHWIVSYPTDCR